MKQETQISGNGKSAGQLMKEVSEDLSTLVRKEVELAKQELGEAASTKAKGAAFVAIAGAGALFAVAFFALALRDGLNEVMWEWVADLVTAGALLVVVLIGLLVARKKLTAPIKADLTKQTIKEDMEWAKTLGRR